jgi:RNA polymerase sigma-B factor
MPMARRVAGRYRNSPQPQEDLHQVAYLALLKAIDRFEPNAGTFAGFAYVCIRGELKRYFRDHATGIRVSRDLQERWMLVSKAQEKLTNDLGRTPTPKEIAARLDLELDDVLEALDAGSAYSVSTLDAPLHGSGDEGVPLSDVVGKEDGGYTTVEFASAVEPAFKALSPRDQEIVRLRFQEDLTQKEIAKAVGISQMQVSRILRRALNALLEAS